MRMIQEDVGVQHIKQIIIPEKMKSNITKVNRKKNSLIIELE
jgi:hypothetical protein